MSSRSLLLLAEVVIGLSCLGLALVIVGARLHRVRATRRTARLVAPHRPMLLAVASGEDAEGSARAHLASLPAATWEHVRSAAVAMLAKVRGAPAETLVSLLHAHAEVERALGRLRSRSAVRRARAAYLLGLLHDPANVPALVPLLSDPSPDVRLVAARSLGLIGDPAAAGAVLSAVPSRDGRMGIPAWVAAEALLGMGLGVAPVLREALASAGRRRQGRRRHGRRGRRLHLGAAPAAGPARPRPVTGGPDRRRGGTGPPRWPPRTSPR